VEEHRIQTCQFTGDQTPEEIDQQSPNHPEGRCEN
jgi:hypothetical protein